MLNIFGDILKLFGIYENNEKLAGGFCLYVIGRLNLKIHLNSPFTPCIGPFLRTEVKNPVSIMNKWKEAINLVAKTIDNLAYSVVSISLNKSMVDTQPFI